MYFSNKEFRFDIQEGNYLLQYLKQVPVSKTKFLDIPYSKLRNDFLEFEFEDENKAIAIYLDDIKLGYVASNSSIYKMLINYLNDNDWNIYAWLSLFNEEDKIIKYQVAFYKVFSDEDNLLAKHLVFHLTSRTDDFESSEENKNVSIMPSDNDVYEVLDDCGLKIGYLSKKDSKILEHYFDGDYDIYSYIDTNDLIQLFIYKLFEDDDEEDEEENDYDEVVEENYESSNTKEEIEETPHPGFILSLFSSIYKGQNLRNKKKYKMKDDHDELVDEFDSAEEFASEYRDDFDSYQDAIDYYYDEKQED